MIGLALSGGGSRAIAFHLGCLRALHDRSVLKRIRVISGVSGGAVIAAMYAYSNEDFAQFDARVVTTLRAGFNNAIVRQFFSPRMFLAISLPLMEGALSISMLRTGGLLLLRSRFRNGCRLSLKIRWILCSWCSIRAGATRAEDWNHLSTFVPHIRSLLKQTRP